MYIEYPLSSSLSLRYNMWTFSFNLPMNQCNESFNFFAQPEGHGCIAIVIHFKFDKYNLLWYNVNQYALNIVIVNAINIATIISYESITSINFKYE